jgi:abequosyltransferase
MQNKLLSICIPTYAQPLQIRQTLESFLDQDLENVEIIIRDDNLDYKTEAIVCEYLERLPIKYFHMIKEGIDPAFIFLTQEASGYFVWWFGDDVLQPGVVGRVVNFLRHNLNLDVMYINSTDKSGVNYSIKIGCSRFFGDKNDALLMLRDQLGFCSAMLFRKSVLLSGLINADRFIGSSWVTLFLALNTLAVGKSFYFMNGKNFLSDSKIPGEIRWYDPFEVHGINFFIVMQEFKDVFDRKTLRYVLSKKFANTWRAVVLERALGFNVGFASPSSKIVKMTKFYWSYPEFYIALPFMLIPRKVLRKLYVLYKFIK